MIIYHCLALLHIDESLTFLILVSRSILYGVSIQPTPR